MDVAVVGSKSWKDYHTLIRKMTVLVEDWTHSYPDDNKLNIWHTGSAGAERMVAEWVGKVDTLAKQNGKIIKDRVFFSPNQLEDLATFGVDVAIVFDDGEDPRCKVFSKFAKASGIYVIFV